MLPRAVSRAWERKAVQGFSDHHRRRNLWIGASCIMSTTSEESQKRSVSQRQAGDGNHNVSILGAGAFDGCASTTFKPRRPFCGKCRKAQSLCICVRIKTVVDNRVGITILQHPEEKDHHLGSARIAALSLRNVVVVSIPEADGKLSFRIRDKVPGSKRSMAGRVGNKGKVRLSASVPVQHSGVGLRIGVEGSSDVEDELSYVIPSWMNLPPGAGLLFPSDKAVDLVTGTEISGHENVSDRPTHLIVLDGTWSKAKRIYFENLWLHKLPHYSLPLSAPSMYGHVRRQPKPGCLSTVESIVFALRILEPDTKGLDSLLEVFDSMITDAKWFQEQSEQKLLTQNKGCL